MKSSVPPLPQSEIDRLCELASVGASLASAAFSVLIGANIQNRAPRVCGPADSTASEHWCTGILFEAEGDLTGLVAIVLPELDRNFAVEQMLGESGPRGPLAESALRELGNIVASQTVSAIADCLGTTILLSVPTLVMEDAGVVLRSLISQRGAGVRIETDLYGTDGEVNALLVFAPDAPKPAAI
jgi:chemotaxis protein CheC